MTLKDPCWICKRREADRNVVLSDRRIVSLCDTCWERSEDDVRIPLDYEDDDDE